MKKVAVYDPYLDTLGGGEKYILSILKVLIEKGFETTIFWHDKNILEKINKTFSLQFNIKLEQWRSSIIRTLLTLKTFDYFFYVTDGSYFFSPAKKNFIYAMVPQKNLYRMNFLNRLKTFNTQFICHSQFTQNNLDKWGIKSQLLYPYIDIPMNAQINKNKLILNVGRFFKHLHSKRQDLAIATFKKLRQLSNFKDYQLILAGGLKEEDENYYHELQKLSNNDPSIIFKPNLSHFELNRLYRLSAYYWHFTGYDIDEEKNPQLVEHMGITPLEAMSHQTIPFCYNAGGPKEIITDGKNGFLFNNQSELLEKMSKIINNIKLQDKIRVNARKLIEEKFSYEIFKKRTLKILNIKV